MKRSRSFEFLDDLSNITDNLCCELKEMSEIEDYFDGPAYHCLLNGIRNSVKTALQHRYSKKYLCGKITLPFVDNVAAFYLLRHIKAMSDLQNRLKKHQVTDDHVHSFITKMLSHLEADLQLGDYITSFAFDDETEILTLKYKI